MIFDDGTNNDRHVSEKQQESPTAVPNAAALHACLLTATSFAPDSDGLFSPCGQCGLKRENNILRCQSAYWQAMHQKAKEREAALIQDKEALQARVKQLEDMVFSQSSEKNSGKPADSLPDNNPKKGKKKRGQQEGSPGHGRRNRDNLPVVPEEYDLAEDEKCCPFCRLPFIPGFDAEESDIVEVEVSTHVRRIRRKKYLKGCQCENLPAVLTAPGPAKLIPKSVYGDSVWIEVLLDKFHTFRPTHRLIQSLEMIGLDLPQGTVTDGLKRLTPFFEPVYQAIVAHNQTASHWHADETRWMVFSPVEGKVGYRWWLWVFASADSVVFILDPFRSARVPEAHLHQAFQAFVSVDRYSAYKTVAKNADIELAFCWTHVRRDFIVVAKGYPSMEQWAMDWVGDIADLYRLNQKRLDAPPETAKRDDAQAGLETAVQEMAQKRDAQLQRQPALHPAAQKVLESMRRHWDGLTLFVDNPEIPMDNNLAERMLRGPVSGRKAFYGSGAQWSGELAVMMFTIFQTLKLWDINPKTWLQSFFRACAENGSTAPADLSAFLPWDMDDERKKALELPPPPCRDTS
jgi:transposase